MAADRPTGTRRFVVVSALLLLTLSRAGAADSAPEPAQKLDPLNVSASRYKTANSEVPGGKGVGAWLFPIYLGPPPQLSAFLETMVVTATRTPQPPARIAATTYLFDSTALRTAPATTLDTALRVAPSFSLFRRSDSLTANPTTQGVSLRGLGPSGASRSLVLLDGVPLNDPFGGWVNWSVVPRDAIGKVEVVPGAGATVWGNAALGGVIQIFTRPPKTEQIIIDRPPDPISWGHRGTLQLSAEAGDFGTRAADVVANQPAGPGILQLTAEDFTTSGFLTVAPERRGPIDVPAWSRHRSLAIRWRVPLGPQSELSATVRSYEEFRGNGTPDQRNGTRQKTATAQAAGQPTDGFAWEASAFAEVEAFASTFTSVNATRTAETPASDQFAVPATAWGASWTGAWTRSADVTTSVGGDFRTVKGETRENFAYANGAYTRQRIAGGSQAMGGLFVLRQQKLTASLSGTLGARLDAWSDEDGHRRESLLATGAITRDDRYSSRNGVETSPNIGGIWTPARGWRVHGSAQHAFRRPTLNELYRPFRQGSNVTEANAGLDTESVTSAEIGADWSWRPTASARPAAPAPRDRHLAPGFAVVGPKSPDLLVVGATLFWNDLRNAVSNVTVARGPGVYPLFGTLPAGGTGRERLNVARTRVQGLELSLTWHPAPFASVFANYLYDDAWVADGRITHAPGVVPLDRLDGKRLAEVPRNSGSVGGTVDLPWNLRLTPRLRWMGRQFDDDQNTLRLGSVAIVDVRVSRPVGKYVEVFVNIENVGNARIETARSADGTVNIGTPRLAVIGVHGKW